MFKRSLESLVAGVCVYAVMAACSGGGASGPLAGSGDAGGPVASEGGQPAKGGAKSTAEAGESMAGSPVPNAMAAGSGGGEGECGCQPVEPKEPTIVKAECDTSAAGTPSVFAVAEFPGKSALELAHVVALIEYPAGIQKWPSGFVTQMGTPIVQDGSVAVGCGTSSAPGANAVKVTFVLP